MNTRQNSIPLELNPDLKEKLDGLPPENSYQNEDGVRRDVGPYIPEPKTAIPSFGETFIHAMPFLRQLADVPDLNPISDITPSDYTAASDENNFVGVLPKNQGYIAAASSPNDAFFRRLDVLKQQQDDEYFENGSMLAKFAGGFVDSLPFAIIPLGQAAKYAQLSRAFLESTLRATPGLAIGSLLHEGSVQASRIGGNIEDTLRDTFIDTLAGLAFVGAGAGLGHTFEGVKLFNAREIFKVHFQGINADIKVDNEGKVLGFKAVPQDGMNVGAAEVDNAQAFLDSTFAMDGLFAIPKIGGLMSKTISLANPIFRGLSSPFETVRGFADRSASHGLITEGIKAGRAKPEDFETLMGIVQAENKLYYGQMKTLLDRRNDINGKSSIVNLAERTRKKWQDEGYTSPEKFGKEIKSTIISGNTHENGVVNEAAALTKLYLDSTWELYRQVFNLPKDWMPPPTSEGYFPRIYNLSLMIERPQQWQDMWVGWWQIADKEINTAMKPINDFELSLSNTKKVHNELINNKTSTIEQRNKSIRDLKAMKRKFKKMKEDLADKIRSDKRMFLHAEDQAGLSGKESRDLKKLLKPIRMKKRELKKQRTFIAELNKKKLFLSEKVDEISVAKAKDIASELEKARTDLKDLKDKYFEEQEKLQDLASQNKINPRLFNRIPETERVAFKNPNDLIKLRKPFESLHHMQQEAEGLHSTILNQTPEHSLQQVLGNYIGSASANPTLKRSQMIPDEIIHSNNFLSDNLPLVVANYRNALHRKISLKQVYGDVTIDGGIEPIVERLTKEFNNKKNALIQNANLKDEQRAKSLKQLNKDFDQAKEYMQLTYNRMMGRTRGGKKMNKYIRFARLWTVSTRLGSVPLTMITDLSANIYKHGFWPTIRDGLVPALENIQHRIKTGEGKEFIDNAAHAHLGLSTVLSANNDRDWGGIAMEHVPLTGTLGSFMEHAAHISGNIALTNQAENNLQKVAASIIQSKIMRYMIQHKKGELAKKDLEKLLLYGLDPKEWAERFINGWKSRGRDGSIKGSYQSRYWEWDDVEAANKMSRTIYKGVNDTIIKKGMMDAPFFFDDPIWGTLVFFHGWSTAALTRYLVPLMQRPDAEHLTGLVWMLAAGSLVSPLRRISKGESPIDDDSNMFKDALTDSGILTPIMGLIENANIMTNGRILHGISNDKYRQRSIAGASGGPVLGVADDLRRIIGMFLDGRLNETDVKKAGRLIPAMQPWYLKGLQNKMIESLDLPRTAADARNNTSNAYR